MDDFVAKAESLIQQLREAEERERKTRWVPMSEGHPKGLPEVDLYIPVLGRVTGYSWANGRAAWVRVTVHGVEELHAAPSHWRPAPEDPK